MKKWPAVGASAVMTGALAVAIWGAASSQPWLALIEAFVSGWMFSLLVNEE
jgi:hypothetical protein